VKKKPKGVPKAVSEYMAALAHKANAAMKGTSTAHDRASKAAKARWAKQRAKRAKEKPQDESQTIAGPSSSEKPAE
jgi:hypothetical protein